MVQLVVTNHVVAYRMWFLVPFQQNMSFQNTKEKKKGNVVFFCFFGFGSSTREIELNTCIFISLVNIDMLLLLQEYRIRIYFILVRGLHFFFWPACVQ